MNAQDAKTARLECRAQCEEGLISELELERALVQINCQEQKWKKRWYTRLAA